MVQATCPARGGRREDARFGEIHRLTRLAQAGDPVAWGQLLAAHEAAMYRIALRILHNHDDAADAVQEARIRTWLHLPELRTPQGFSRWFTAATVHTALETLRRRRRHTDRSAPWGEAIDAPLPGDASDRLWREELAREVRETVRRVRPVYAGALWLWALEVSAAESAAILGVPAGTVKTRWVRGRAAFQQLWKGEC